MLLVNQMLRPEDSIRPLTSCAFKVQEIRQGALPPGILAVWVRLGGLDSVTVATCVPAGSVSAVARHLRAHASEVVAQALGMVVCDASECSAAFDWLHSEDEIPVVTAV